MEEAQKVAKKNKGIITIVILALICLGVGFFGGMQFQKSQKITTKNGNLQTGFPSGSGRPSISGKNGMNGNQPVSGEIISIDSGSITVKTTDGGSKIVMLSGSTKISLATEGSTSDLKKGDTVLIIGTTGTDGTVSATSVSIGGETLRGGQPPQGN